MKAQVKKLNSIVKSVDPFYLTIKEVSKMTGLGKSSVHRLEKEGKFPKRITLNKTRVVWLYSEVLSWCILLKDTKGYPPKKHYV